MPLALQGFFLSLNHDSSSTANSRSLCQLADADVNAVLLALADEAVRQPDFILAENAKDLARMDRSSPLYDRLLLSGQAFQQDAILTHR
jgi:gamma-glutamyl phosphate reductase